MEKKYKLTEESIIYFGRTLYRIEALKDFGNVKKGDLGGWIESEDNLSQEGNCWIHDNVKVCNHARVYDNAIIGGNVLITNSAKIHDTAFIGHSPISGKSPFISIVSASISKNAFVTGQISFL